MPHHVRHVLHRRDYFPLFLAILFIVAAMFIFAHTLGAQTTGTLTILSTSGGTEMGDISSVGDCSTGDCFQVETGGTFLGAPLGGGVATFRAITVADLPVEMTTDLELANTVSAAVTAHADDADAHHNWPLLDADISQSAVTQHQAAIAITESQITDLVHTIDTDTDTTCLDAGVDCLFAGSSSEGGPATTALALAANGANCSPGNYPLGVDASGNAESCTAANTGSGDVVGPASATNNAFALFSGTTGKLIKNSTLTWDGADLTLPVSTQIQVAYGDATDPSIEGPNGSGIYWAASSGVMNLTVAGVAGWSAFNCSGALICFYGGVTDAPGLISRATSATAPNILPSRESLGSGLGGARNAPALIVSSVSRVTATATGATVNDILRITPQVTAPATCSIGDIYVDTSGEMCACTSTNTWTGTTGIGSCV